MAFLFSFDCPDQGSAKSRSGKLVCRGQRTLAKQSRISLACSAGCSQAAKWPPAEKLPACDPRIETSCDVLFANAVAKAPPIRPVPITTIFFTLLLLGLAALRRSMDQGTATIFPICCCSGGDRRPRYGTGGKPCQFSGRCRHARLK